MTGRARTFAWICGIAGPVPQVWFDDPPVGRKPVTVASRKIGHDDERTLSELAAAYPAPASKED